MAQLWDKQPDARRADPASPPKEQLNPATNPLLGKHLGRWAQVYYTSPPEKREQAVADLLRELESETSEIKPHAGAAKANDRAPRHEVVCAQCGRANDFQQQFCTYCGFRLHTNRNLRHATRDAQVALRYAALTRVPQPAASNQVVRSKDVDSPETSERRILLLREKALSSSDEAVVPAGSSWIKITVAALVILLAAVIYLYRSGTRWPPADSRAQKAITANSHDSPTSGSRSQSGLEPARTVQPPISSSASRTGYSSEQLPRTVTSLPPTEDAAQDLLLAQRDLASAAQPRDPTEAATWLWKAVGKQNSQAALMLADLYLKGDGVARSCDQARMLLVAAVEKGNKEASQRLQNLESYGCH